MRCFSDLLRVWSRSWSGATSSEPNDCCRGGSSTSDCKSQLLQLLADQSDVVLVFMNPDGTVKEVPAHSTILKQWSQVLAEALSTAHNSSSSDTTDRRPGKISIPMVGTEKEDWLLAMMYVYPVTTRPPTICWICLEVLLLLGDKYGMPALQEVVSTILVRNASVLSLDPSGGSFIWKWIVLADRHGLHAAARACVDSQRQIAALLGVCPADALSQLSEVTLCHLATVMEPWVVKPGQTYCSRCARLTAWDRHEHCAVCDYALRI